MLSLQRFIVLQNYALPFANHPRLTCRPNNAPKNIRASRLVSFRSKCRATCWSHEACQNSIVSCLHEQCHAPQTKIHRLFIDVYGMNDRDLFHQQCSLNSHASKCSCCSCCASFKQLTFNSTSSQGGGGGGGGGHVFFTERKTKQEIQRIAVDALTVQKLLPKGSRKRDFSRKPSKLWTAQACSVLVLFLGAGQPCCQPLHKILRLKNEFRCQSCSFKQLNLQHISAAQSPISPCLEHALVLWWKQEAVVALLPLPMLPARLDTNIKVTESGVLPKKCSDIRPSLSCMCANLTFAFICLEDCHSVKSNWESYPLHSYTFPPWKCNRLPGSTEMARKRPSAICTGLAVDEVPGVAPQVRLRETYRQQL